ncbi:cadmium-translocating P-type ATPase [Marixanthomonas sp. SCSIO 43207]|uniref:heavy metal translocating P-type ATPase n=1 Tax=Marixanthomonas sp. SCSIO 43207 TaxID=2779360 RepID=UPI001CA7BAE9|nr:heavy metal translocating P-type ATPase [Marixanthomonas sp. SCSIO 43207]UAB80955.1 cadmium-translocating P-type ATPase [Marixanthomonas sp. SCSIO 43207]
MNSVNHTTTSCCSHTGCCETENSFIDDAHPNESFAEKFKTYLPALFSFILLAIGIILDFTNTSFFSNWVRIVWYGIAYLPVGLPVLKQGFESIKNGVFFTEFLLMSIATLGAFIIGEYPEGVAVMVFYAVGELFQGEAVKKARNNIKALLAVQPNEALVLRKGDFVPVSPETVAIGETVQVRVGEKIPLDGKLLSSKASVNTAALTGESKPNTIRKGQDVYAGSINLESVIEIETTKEFKDSSIARILNLVQNATERKSKTELFIRKFARIYTPIVVMLAIGVTLLPYFFVSNYVFEQWLYRALIFLVISCPCALVISIPLGYFGGLGNASRHGILFKGASFLDTVTKINTVVMDKTGTVTKGVFKVTEIHPIKISENELISYVIALEKQSTHPIAKAILAHKTDDFKYMATDVSEISGKGLSGIVNGKQVLAGNISLLKSKNISVPSEIENITETTVFVAIDEKFVGYLIIADELKTDAVEAINQIKKSGVSKIIMLSGDTDAITQKIANHIGIDAAKGDLLPEDKLNEVEKLKQQPNTKVAFVGDGINDAPVLATSDVGFAMGGLGSDVAIETADVIIQTDQPSKVATAIQIGRSTRKIIWQNIALAFVVKGLVMALGTVGLATMWEAVFADVGVALLAILNAVRLQKMNWN